VGLAMPAGLRRYYGKGHLHLENMENMGTDGTFPISCFAGDMVLIF
jgi:hypothetical protein